jgi:iron-sulfur cluster repair protein YtfE (RIC family)
MDALELLKIDHQRASSLFKQIENTDDRRLQWHLFLELREELRTHSQLEETVFYPFLARFAQLERLIERSFRDHAELSEELDAIQQLGHVTADALFRLRDLHETVESHVSEEENELFPRVRGILRRPEREQLGRHMEALRGKRAA